MMVKRVINSRPILGLTVLAAFLTLTACASTTVVHQGGEQTTGGGNGLVYRGDWPAGQPWDALADRLVGSGFSQRQVETFLNSPELQYSHRPMETKLRELYGIFYKSERTRAIQEKLYQLGHDILIDGRLGQGTRNVIKRFQSSQGLAQTGEPSDALVTELDRALKTGRVRPLSSYTPPPVQKPSRTATHRQFTSAEALRQITALYHGDLGLFQRMEKKYQVPGPVAAGILWIETGYGNYLGKNRAASMLASMAAAADFRVVEPAVSDLAADAEARAWLGQTASQRGGWAFDELSALLRYSFHNRLDPNALPGSIYGAIGLCQFMPSNVLKYGDDGDGDGRIDLFNKADAVFSIGRYLSENGWAGDMRDEEKRREAIMSYNRSGVYVNTVLYVANWIAAH